MSEHPSVTPFDEGPADFYGWIDTSRITSTLDAKFIQVYLSPKFPKCNGNNQREALGSQASFVGPSVTDKPESKHILPYFYLTPSGLVCLPKFIASTLEKMHFLHVTWFKDLGDNKSNCT